MDTRQIEHKPGRENSCVSDASRLSNPVGLYFWRANMKRCTGCGETKPLDDFYKKNKTSTDRSSRCKQCQIASAKRYYRRTFPSRQAYNRQYNQTPQRKAAHAQHGKNERTRHPLRLKARDAVIHAIRDGRLLRQPCEVCGAENVEGHHDDYAKPLDVRWLCFEHHRIAHGQIGHVTAAR